jgi:UDP-2-acetamido-2,6-beta-L-arabino-hexul-4-ose reductase
MKILVTGARGFIGKNLIAELRNRGFDDLLEFNRGMDLSLLEQYTRECEFVFHLAGVNRPKELSEFADTNVGLTKTLIEYLMKNKNRSPVVVTSSIQADHSTPYGVSKKEAEDLWIQYVQETNVKVCLYRLPNVFGKWCRPHYNSVVATFCYNIARGLDIEIHQEDAEITLCYIDDVMVEFLDDLENHQIGNQEIFRQIPVTYRITVKELADKLIAFSHNRDTLKMPSLQSPLDRALYATYLTYLEESNFSYSLSKREDERGWLAEFIKSDHGGQIFISKTKPGITRGNHWHHTKVEKFLVLQGEALIKFRKYGTQDILVYRVNGNKPEVVDIPAGYAHSITNIGTDDVITLFWASEIFDPMRPDTYRLEV